MHKLTRLIAGAASLTALLAPPAAFAQQPRTMTVGTTIITVGGGAQLLALPDIDFSFRADSSNGNSVGHQKNSDLDDYGGVVVGSIETPLAYLGGIPVTSFLSGFFANVDDTDTTRCFTSRTLSCFAEDIVDHPGVGDSIFFRTLTTQAKREVDYWGASAEARFGKAPAPVRDSGGYLFRLAYVGIGPDFRGIDQDNTLNLYGATSPVRYTETLDTTYWGGFVSIGGEYNILGYLGVGDSWGLRSMVSLRAGVYDANTDYDGHFTADGFRSTRLGLSNDKAAFIGSASFETRKQLGPRTSLSLVTDYEYYSYAPQMRYVDQDTVPGHVFLGGVRKTQIADDDAFEVRTTLRLNVSLGALAPAGYPNR
jgi:hypothetical protein